MGSESGVKKRSWGRELNADRQRHEDVGKEWEGSQGGGAGTAAAGRFTSIYGVHINLCHQRPCPQKSKEACPTEKKEASLR